MSTHGKLTHIEGGVIRLYPHAMLRDMSLKDVRVEVPADPNLQRTISIERCHIDGWVVVEVPHA